MRLITEKGFTLGNIDATLISETPKIYPYIGQIKNSIATICGIGDDEVGVKATTAEKMGFVGRREGIEAHAVVLIEKISL